MKRTRRRDRARRGWIDDGDVYGRPDERASASVGQWR